MTRYSVSGTLTPDATTADTGEPAGTYNGQPYWTWGTWYLFLSDLRIIGQPSNLWAIADNLDRLEATFVWFGSTGVEGAYTPAFGNPATGTATVAEYAPSSDDTPDAFAFSAVTDADPSTLYVSDSQEITGMDAGTAISIVGGEYRIGGGAWTSDPGTIDPGDTLELRSTSSAESEGVVTVTVTVGTVSVDWTITTASVPAEDELIVVKWRASGEFTVLKKRQ